MNQQEQANPMVALIAKCWADEAFKQMLLANPAAVLKAEGLAIPPGVEVVALENSDTVFNLVIPAVPKEGELSDGQLGEISGGFMGHMVAFAELILYAAKKQKYRK